MKQLQKVLDNIHETMLDRMYEAVKDGQNHVLVLIDVTPDIQVDIELTGYDAEVCVFNKKNLEHYYPNIEAKIIEALPLWDEIKVDDNIWDAHGFANEADYLRWKYAS